MMSAFEAQIRELVCRIAEGEGLNADELVAKYLGAGEPLSTKAPAAKKKREAKVTVATSKCTAKTAKGKPCSLNALPGTCMCRVHANKAEESPAPPAAVEEGEASAPPAAPTKKKAAAAKKKKASTEAPPTHTHALDNTGEACELCHTHGNALTEGDDEEEFETVTSPRRSLRQRLMEIAQTEEDYEDEEE